PYIFALKRLLTGVGRQEAAVLDDGNDVEESLTLRLGGEMRESQVGAERGHRERPLAMLLAHLRQVFERCVILVEFILPAANLNLPQLRMFKGPPVDKCLAIHLLVIPAHDLKIVLFWMPANPLYKVARSHSCCSRQVPQFRREA